jgi:hypothetical protein
MQRWIVTTVAALLLSGCVSGWKARPGRSTPRREAALVVLAAAGELAAATLLAFAATRPGEPMCPIGDPDCSTIDDIGSDLAGRFLVGGMAIGIGVSGLGDLGVGLIQLASGRYVRATRDGQ